MFIEWPDSAQIALGMYDFELTAMVGQRSQKDPKEYMPELTRLHAVSPPLLQRFAIDCYLKRPQKALQHILEAGREFREVRGLQAAGNVWSTRRCFYMS